LAPLFLLESWAALVTLDATSVMLAAAGEDAHWTLRVLDVTGIGVSVAHAPSSDRDVLDRVEVTTRHRGILSSHGHQMSQKILCAEQTDPDIGGTGPFLQHR